MLDKFKDAFREEAQELLVNLETLLLELEADSTDMELINAAFRAVHTIKGSAGMFGFERISRFTHDFETLLDSCRSGKCKIDKHLIDLSLKARDIIREMLAEEDSPAPFGEIALQLMNEFRLAVNSCGDSAPEAAKAPVPLPAVQPESQSLNPVTKEAVPVVSNDDSSGTYRIFFKPPPSVFKNGTRVLKLFEELAELGELSAHPRMRDIPDLDTLDPEQCYVAWDIILTTNNGSNAIQDVFIFIDDAAELKIERLDNPDELSSDQPKKLGEILVERGLLQADALGIALKSQRKLGEVLLEKNIVSPGELESALVEQAHLKRAQEKQSETAGSIRVSSDKLDQLVDLVGEMVTLQARLARTSIQLSDTGLSSISEQFERLVSQLRDNAMSVRMLPIGSTFNKFRRVVRDLSAELGKEVELLTEGADTELDKTVIERLNDPLVHIIRNSLDHGIEKPQDRLAAGKQSGGKITLSAQHSGAHVVISVSDDGKGLDLSAIRAKAVERGIISANQELSEEEAFMLIFRPGFSTAKNVTSVSGRGVGMDVVKREIDSLGGMVNVESISGKGSKISLKIPLTLAIIEGLLVRIGDEFFVLPLSSVEGCVELSRDEKGTGNNGQIMRYREELLPYIDLRDFFSVPGAAPALSQVVVINSQGSHMGLVVDNVIGDYQTVIKPLGRMFKNAAGLSGATILGDGTVALIVDFNRLANHSLTAAKKTASVG